MKKILSILVILVLFLPLVLGQQLNEVVKIQPKIMVIPYTMSGEDIRTVLENDINKRIVLSKIKEAFDNRGFTTIDFSARLKAASTDSYFPGLNKTDAKAQIIQMSGADIYVEAEINVSKSEDSGNRVKIILQAYEVSAGNSLSNKIGQSSSFADIGTIAAKAIDNCIEDFLNTMQAKFSDIVKDGKSTIINIGFDQNSEYNASSEVGSQGYLLSDEIELWMSENSYKNNYHLQGISENGIIFDDVRIPLIDPKNGNNYTLNNFGMAFFRFLRSLGISSKRDIKGNTLYITIQ